MSEHGTSGRDNGTAFWTALAVVAAAVPLVAYYLAYCFETGFARAVGIPQDLITVRTESVLYVGSILLLILTAVYGIWGMILYPMLAPLQNRPARLALAYALFLTPAVAYVVMFGAQWREWLFIVTPYVIIGLFEFVLPLYWQRGVKGYTKKLEAQAAAEKRLLQYMIS